MASPAGLIWQEIVTVTKELKLFNEEGGGVIISPHWTDDNWLADAEQSTDWYESEKGNLEPLPQPEMRNWITTFQTFESYQQSHRDIEIRPAWFHLANHAFFNAPVQRLPVFYGTFNNKGKVEILRFLDEYLSDRAREYIGKALFGLPIKLRKQANKSALKHERQGMVWWLWHNVGYEEEKRPLSWREIANIAHTSRSSIQTAVERFHRKLKNDMDRQLLGRLLRTGSGVGLGYNKIYKTLVQQGLAPPREREIDSFDDINNLI